MVELTEPPNGRNRLEHHFPHVLQHIHDLRFYKGLWFALLLGLPRRSSVLLDMNLTRGLVFPAILLENLSVWRPVSALPRLVFVNTLGVDGSLESVNGL